MAHGRPAQEALLGLFTVWERQAEPTDGSHRSKGKGPQAGAAPGEGLQSPKPTRAVLLGANATGHDSPPGL